jgi:hypothetical protein
LIAGRGVAKKRPILPATGGRGRPDERCDMAKKTAKKSSKKATKKTAKKSAKKNSLVNNINKRKKSGKSRPKSRTTISKKAYAKMESGWKK